MKRNDGEVWPGYVFGMTKTRKEEFLDDELAREAGADH